MTPGNKYILVLQDAKSYGRSAPLIVKTSGDTKVAKRR